MKDPKKPKKTPSKVLLGAGDQKKKVAEPKKKKNAKLNAPPEMEILEKARRAIEYFGVAEVVVPNTVLGVLSFGVSKGMRVGSAVWVSLRGRKKPILGLAVKVKELFQAGNGDLQLNFSENGEDLPKFKLKEAVAHKSGYAFSERYVETILWCASYYMCSLGEALTAFWGADFENYLSLVETCIAKPQLAASLPADQACGGKEAASGERADFEREPISANLQAGELAVSGGSEVGECELPEKMGSGKQMSLECEPALPAKLREAQGIVSRSEGAEMPKLTQEQEKAVEILSEMLFGLQSSHLDGQSYNGALPETAAVRNDEAGNFRGALLNGVTGSGKTRVYLEVVKRALGAGIPSLILVPEINLTPQTRGRFEEFLGAKVPILHSSLGAKEKRENYLLLLKGETKILMGTRSAILAPFEPKLIIIDEEHDASYKQHDPAPRYHTREMAFHIAHKFGALVVLGSATPSVESWHNAAIGNLKLLTMKNRPTGFPLPKADIVDMKKNRQDKDLMLSPDLRDAISQTLMKGEQAIILMNRRGYNSAVACAECGENLECRHCKVSLVFHLQYGKLMCHYCGRLYNVSVENSLNCRLEFSASSVLERGVNSEVGLAMASVGLALDAKRFVAGGAICKCGGKEFIFSGGGIEKAQEEILEWIPAARVLRLDSDSTGGIGATEKILKKFRNGEYNVLLGTQMVAKGHDFPRVSLVGVIGADIGTGIPDFRAGERTFQLLTQVAGRAGRSLEDSRVVVQTFCPENPVIQFAVKHDYLGFAEWELTERKDAFYPPFCKIATIRLQGKNKHKVEKAGIALANVLKNGAAGAGGVTGFAAGFAAGKMEILGPVEPFVSKAQNQYRRHIIVKTGSAALLKNAVKNALADSVFLKAAKGVEARVERDG